MTAYEFVPTDRLDGAARRLVSLEAKGVRLRAGKGRVTPSGALDGVTDDDRNWIGEHQLDLLELLEVRPIQALSEDPSPDRIFDLAPPQMGMWTGAQHPDPAVQATVFATNQSIRLLCIGPMDVEAMQRAFRRVTLKHPALRARLERETPRQGFHPADEMRVAYRDLSGLDTAAVLGILDEEEQSACDFFGGKLARATLFRLAENRHFFHLVCNHVIIDGWSGPILTRDIVSAYRSAPGDDASWREQGRLYFGYLDWEQSSRQKARQSLAVRRWRRWLSDAPSRSISARLDNPRTGEKEFCDAVYKGDLDPSVAPYLGRAGAALGVTPGTVVVAAIMLLLAEESDCSTPIALMLDSGRLRPEQARLCSFFAIPLPIGMCIQHGDSLQVHTSRVAEVLRERRGEPLNWTALLEAYPHRPIADPDNLAPFTFNIVNFDMRDTGMTYGDHSAQEPGQGHAGQGGHGPAAGQLRFMPTPSSYPGYALPGDVCLNITIRRQLSCAWNYNSKIIEPSTIARLATRLGEIITLIGESPLMTVGEALCARVST